MKIKDDMQNIVAMIECADILLNEAWKKIKCSRKLDAKDREELQNLLDETLMEYISEDSVNIEFVCESCAFPQGGKS